MAGLGVSFVCLAGAVLAGNAFLGVAHASLGTSSSAKELQESGSVIIVNPNTGGKTTTNPGGGGNLALIQITSSPITVNAATGPTSPSTTAANPVSPTR